MKNIVLIIISIHLIFVKADFLRKCRKETSVSWASLRKLKAGDLNTKDLKLKCYLRCVLIKHGILNWKNEIILEKAVRFLPKEMQMQARSSFAKCRSSHPDKILFCVGLTRPKDIYNSCGTKQRNKRFKVPKFLLCQGEWIQLPEFRNDFHLCCEYKDLCYHKSDEVKAISWCFCSIIILMTLASLGGFALGVTLAWNSRVGHDLKDTGASIIEMGLVGLILNLGACFGVLCVPFMLKMFNHASAMFMIVPVFLIGWSFICFSQTVVIYILIGRSICGICGGILCVLTPIYVAEIADKEIRNRLLTFFHLLLNCGIMYAFVIAYIMEEHNCIWQYSLICALSCAPIALVSLLPESSLHHMSRNEISAKMSFKRYKGESYESNEELEELKSLAVIYKRKVSCKIFKSKKIWQSFFACLIVILTQQLSLINILISCASSLIEFGDLSGDFETSEAILIIGGTQIISCVLATILVDLIGRRILLVFSATCMGIFLVLLGWFINLKAEDLEYKDIYSWMPLTWISLYFAAFNIGVGPLSWSLHADSFPVEIKVIGATVVVFFSWGMSLVAIIILYKLLSTYDAVTTIWAFAGFSWISAIILLFFVKETKGKSLVDIQVEFGIEEESVN